MELAEQLPDFSVSNAVAGVEAKISDVDAITTVKASFLIIFFLVAFSTAYNKPETFRCLVELD